MITGNPRFDLIMAAILIVALLSVLALRRYVGMIRIRRYTGGSTPETLDFGVVFYGYSTDTGPLRSVSGAVFATSEALVFLGQDAKSTVVEMPWRRLEGWTVVNKFRHRPLQRKMVSMRLGSEVGEPVEVLLAMPRPHFWTHLVDIANKQKNTDKNV